MAGRGNMEQAHTLQLSPFIRSDMFKTPVDAW
jgi:hypothetical protein